MQMAILFIKNGNDNGEEEIIVVIERRKVDIKKETGEHLAPKIQLRIAIKGIKISESTSICLQS